MKYLVNRETKEHKRMPFGCLYAPTGWRIFQADPLGWLPHNGGECPLPDDCRVSVLFSDGTINATEEASYWGWRDSAPTHYRPILEDKPQPESDEQMLERREAEGVNRLLEKYPDYDPRSVSFNLLDRLAAAHQSASEIPELVEQLRAQLEPLGLGVMYLSQFDEVEPEPDMSDWRNWRAGDLVARAKGAQEGFSTLGRVYEIDSVDPHKMKIFYQCDDGSITFTHARNGYFKFHSRPEPTT